MTSDLTLTWHDRVRVLLTRSNSNQRAMCREALDRYGIQISEFTMSEMMNGRMQPNSDLVAAVCLVLRKRPSDLGFERTGRVEVGWRLAELELAASLGGTR